MKKQLRIIVWNVFVLTLFNGCTKENGKHEYILRLEFSSGDVWEESAIMREKTENIFDKGSYKQSKDIVLLDLIRPSVLIKVDNHYFVGINGIEMTVVNFNMINGQSGKIIGGIELQGTYKRKMREYLVEDGDFKFRFNGVPYNLPDTIYTGKWTLKRK